VKPLCLSRKRIWDSDWKYLDPWVRLYFLLKMKKRARERKEKEARNNLGGGTEMEYLRLKQNWALSIRELALLLSKERRREQEREGAQSKK